MSWPVRLHVEFEPEFAQLPESVQDKLLALMALLVEYGPWLGRPHADTLNGSRHANMKELRFNAAGGVWRVTYAFDPKREAILLLAGDKSGGSESRFYKTLNCEVGCALRRPLGDAAGEIGWERPTRS